ncbi:hypothetical protein [Microcoleus sp. bin38.metabat.b11b12b14.051]|nr:hypothetical protein [Microcoleus sp. bin38.metabat.b11b12b14.051]
MSKTFAPHAHSSPELPPPMRRALYPNLSTSATNNRRAIGNIEPI